jgi:hypothetical protein
MIEDAKLIDQNMVNLEETRSVRIMDETYSALPYLLVLFLHNVSGEFEHHKNKCAFC